MREIRFSINVVECSAVNWNKRDLAGAGVIEPYWEVRLEKHQYIKMAELFFTCTSKEDAKTMASQLASTIQATTSTSVSIEGLDNDREESSIVEHFDIIAKAHGWKQEDANHD